MSKNRERRGEEKQGSETAINTKLKVPGGRVNLLVRWFDHQESERDGKRVEDGTGGRAGVTV